MSLDHFTMKWEIKPRYAVAPQDLTKAVRHLNKAIDLLGSCRKTMHKGVYDVFFAHNLTVCWDEVNQCRSYTDKFKIIEDALVHAMGEISNAKNMFDWLVSANQGMSYRGFGSIMRCLRTAELGIRPCIKELESWQKPY